MTNDLFDIGEMAHHGPEDLFIAIMTLVGRVRHHAHGQLAAGAHYVYRRAGAGMA